MSGVCVSSGVAMIALTQTIWLQVAPAIQQVWHARLAATGVLSQHDRAALRSSGGTCPTQHAAQGNQRLLGVGDFQTDNGRPALALRCGSVGTDSARNQIVGDAWILETLILAPQPLLPDLLFITSLIRSPVMGRREAVAALA